MCSRTTLDTPIRLLMSCVGIERGLGCTGDEVQYLHIYLDTRRIF